MPSTTLVACERCEELPTSLCYFSVDNYGLTAAVHLCRKCAPLVSHNRLTRQDLDERGWRVGYTTLSARPRRLETDPRWKHRPSLQHEIITYIMTHMSLVSAKAAAAKLPPCVARMLWACFAWATDRAMRCSIQASALQDRQPVPWSKCKAVSELLARAARTRVSGSASSSLEGHGAQRLRHQVWKLGCHVSIVLAFVLC